MSEDNFQWTDELVAEFVTWSMMDAPLMQGRYSDMQQFKASKQAKPILFRTTDGIDIREGDSYWYADIKESSSPQPTQYEATAGANYGPSYSSRTFSTKEAANEWVLYNKPILSLNDVHEFIFSNNPPTKNYTTLKELAKSKING